VSFEVTLRRNALFSGHGRAAVAEDGRVAHAEIAADRDPLVELAVERPHAGGDREEVEVVQISCAWMCANGVRFPPPGLVRVTVAALRALADHQVRLGAAPAGRRAARARRRRRGGYFRGAHSRIHVRIASISSGERHCPASGAPGQPFGMRTPEMPGAPVSFWKR
jgi:hypothetical protein